MSWRVQKCCTRCYMLTCNVLRKESVLSLYVLPVDAVWHEATDPLTSWADGTTGAESRHQVLKPECSNRDFSIFLLYWGKFFIRNQRGSVSTTAVNIPMISP